LTKTIFDISMSLDGYINAQNPRPEAGLGDGGERLHEWAFNSKDERNRALLARGASLGAIISGRTNYDLSLPFWGADGPTGPARVPIIVLTHASPKESPANHVYTFADGVQAAAKTAGKLAGDKDIAVMGGADTFRQFLDVGLLDEISIHLVPVLFGGGTRLFEEFESGHIPLEIVEVVNTKEAVHVRYRVVK
jgi:dihydrofolate reductase